MGYHRAGFEVVGVDIEPHKGYPFEFHEADALAFPLDEFDAIHASPPCQAYSLMTRNKGTAHTFPDLVAPVRERLEVAGVPYVIENVIGAPLLNAILLCGSSFGLGTSEMQLRRHRLFECNFAVMAPPCAHDGRLSIGVYGNGTNSWHRERLGRNVTVDEMREAMGIDWMVRSDLNQAIPPAYTEHIGHYLMAHLNAMERAA
jgi:DNA (cytosine-5)-methyltransferase 1